MEIHPPLALCTALHVCFSSPAYLCEVPLLKCEGDSKDLQALLIFLCWFLSFKSVTSFSSSKPLFPHFIDLKVFVHCSTHGFVNYFYHSHHFLLFSQSVHATYETFTDYHPLWGSLRLTPIMYIKGI